MNPIFTTNNEKGLNGYSYVEFVYKFDSICKDHLATGKAKKFAFIVYDFHSPTQEVLQNHGVFTDLDRLSGKDITVFYLDGQNKKQSTSQNKLYKNLNEFLAKQTKQNIESIPFILFFDYIEGDVTNFKCYSIRDDEKFILADLIQAISKELKPLSKVKAKKLSSIILSLLKETPKIVYTEFIKLLFKGITS